MGFDGVISFDAFQPCTRSPQFLRSNQTTKKDMVWRWTYNRKYVTAQYSYSFIIVDGWKYMKCQTAKMNGIFSKLAHTNVQTNIIPEHIRYLLWKLNIQRRKFWLFRNSTKPRKSKNHFIRMQWDWTKQ